MDPNATLLLLRAAFTGGDYNLAMDAALDLHSWVFKGGFPPSDTGYRFDIDRVLEMVHITIDWAEVDQRLKPVLLPPPSDLRER